MGTEGEGKGIATCAVKLWVDMIGEEGNCTLVAGGTHLDHCLVLRMNVPCLQCPSLVVVGTTVDILCIMVLNLALTLGYICTKCMHAIAYV